MIRRAQQDRHYLSGRLLAHNALWNILGQGLPLVAAVLSIPYVISHLGIDRFGILTIIWALLGYASVFDLGLGRALTKFVAAKLGAEIDGTIPAAVWSGWILMLGMGMLGGAVLWMVSSYLVTRTLNVPEVFIEETLSALKLVSLAMPLVILTAGFKAVLDAYQQFRATAIVTSLAGTYSYGALPLVTWWFPDLVACVFVMIIGRTLVSLVMLSLAITASPGLVKRFRWSAGELGRMARFGGWITVSNVLAPFMDYLDRFLIGGILNTSVVAYYATPSLLITRLMIVPASLAGVLFPALSNTLAVDPGRAVTLFGSSIRYIFFAMFGPIMLVVVFAKEGLTLWLGAAFAEQSATILQWLAIGVFINSLAQMAFAFVQAKGRADITAKLHLLELIIYLPLLWGLLSWIGLFGAAVAWTFRICCDTAGLFLAGRHLYPGLLAPLSSLSPFLVIAAILLAGGMGVPDSLILKLCYFLLALAAVYVPGWHWMSHHAKEGEIQEKRPWSSH